MNLTSWRAFARWISVQVMKEKVKFNDVVSFEDVRCLGFGVRLVSLSLLSAAWTIILRWSQSWVLQIQPYVIWSSVRVNWVIFAGNSPILGCDPRVFQWPYSCFCPGCHVEIHTPTEVETLKRIHLNYRLQYLKDSPALSTVPSCRRAVGVVALSFCRLGYCSATGPRWCQGILSSWGGVVS